MKRINRTFHLGGIIDHNGGIPGYNTGMFYHPELKAMFIVSVNELGITGEVADDIFVVLAEIVHPEKNFFQKN